MGENPDHDREEVPGRRSRRRTCESRPKRVGSNRPKRGEEIRPRGYACSFGGFSDAGE
jgi:hypothetical protein